MFLKFNEITLYIFFLFNDGLAIPFENNNNTSPIIKLKQGLIRGIRENTLNGREFYSFMKIPFAKPPVGKLRFKDPVEADVWEGILEVNEMPDKCVQLNSSFKITGNEDCLYLNVFTPQVDVKANLSVMVYIHGGAFRSGGANEFFPYALLDEDIVLVIFNYRVNVFGFLSTGDSQMSGNYGLKDQNFALRWVQYNIKEFGGNPDMVTVVGQSAGAASVHAHILSPKSKGLFKRAIMESGSMLCSWAKSKNVAATASKVGQQVNCSLIMGQTEEYVKCLQELDVKELHKILTKQSPLDYYTTIVFTPRVDNDILPDEPEILLRQGKFNHVDIISGNTKEEGAMVIILQQFLDLNKEGNAKHAFQLNDEENATQLLHSLQDFYLHGEQIGHLVRNETIQLFGDTIFTVPQDLTAFFHINETQNKVFQYTFQYKGKYSQTPLNFRYVSHSDELIYLFGQGRLLTMTDDLLMKNMLVKLWTNFVKTGNPTPPGSDLGFVWEGATREDFKFLNITTKPQMIGDFRKNVRNFFLTLKTKQNKLLFKSVNDTEFVIKS